MNFSHWFTTPPPPLFDLKIVYSYVIEVADSESGLGLRGNALVSERSWAFAFYHLLENALWRPGRRGSVHLGQTCFEGIEGFEDIDGIEGIEGIEGFEGFVR